jgi:hypothetical protein
VKAGATPAFVLARASPLRRGLAAFVRLGQPADGLVASESLPLSPACGRARPGGWWLLGPLVDAGAEARRDRRSGLRAFAGWAPESLRVDEVS